MDFQTIQKVFEYDTWANEKVLTALEGMPNPPEEALKKISHILAAKAVWLSRISEYMNPVDMSQTLSIPDCRKLNGELKAKFETLLFGLGEARLSEKIAYKNLKGQSNESLLSDILLQLITHGPYHRGQIASLIKKAEGTPPGTDFIIYARELKA
jgi:uncharacterized damage-inducible protein DinB